MQQGEEQDDMDITVNSSFGGEEGNHTSNEQSSRGSSSFKQKSSKVATTKNVATRDDDNDGGHDGGHDGGGDNDNENEENTLAAEADNSYLSDTDNAEFVDDHGLENKTSVELGTGSHININDHY